ncbi:MAG: S-layer homology domain-containing protein, partial [bacterium]|nr:S-layer homology domain-containing protein [bacterium]
VANGITQGRGDGRFDPGGSVNRAQIVTFLFRLAGLSDIAMDAGVLGSASFADVPAGHWADEEIGWAVANGITQGVGGGMFDMGRVVTRVQIAAFMFRVASAVKPADSSVVGVSSSLERCASAGQPGSGVLAVLTGTSAGGFYEPIVGPGGSCERIMEWWEQARRAEAQRIDRGEYPCEYDSPPEGYGPGEAGETHGTPYFVGCWPLDIAHDASGEQVYPPNSPPFVEALWNCYKGALEGSPPGFDGYWWPTINDCHDGLLSYGHPMRGMGIDPACAAESYTRRVAELLIGEYPTDDGHPQPHSWYYAGPNSWTECSTRAERMVPDTGQTFQQRCLAVIAAAAKDPHTAENIERQAAVYGLEPDVYLTEWGNIVCGDWSFETVKNAEINGVPLEGNVFIAYWHAGPEAQCHQQVILNLAESYLRGGTDAVPAVRFC